MEQLTARIFVELGHHGSNNGVIVADGNDLVLVDAPQLPVDAAHWAVTVAALGTPRFLVNTDHHADHTVGNRWLDGTIVAHRGTRERLLMGPPDLGYLADLFGTIGPDSVPLLAGYVPRLPEVTFDDHLDLWLGDLQVTLLHAPGHTANTVMVHVPEEGVLFTGDNLCEASLPAFVDASVEAVFDAIDLAASLPFDQMVTGHGEVAGRELLARYREWLRELVGRVDDARTQGMTREECGDQIRYEDRIHRDVAGHAAYPAALIDYFQARSIEKIYDDIERAPAVVGR